MRTFVYSASLGASLAQAHIYWYHWQFYIWIVGTAIASLLVEYLIHHIRWVKA